MAKILKDPDLNTTPSSDPEDGTVSHEELLNMQLERAGIPKRYRRAAWDNFDVDYAKLETVIGWKKLAVRLNAFKGWRGQEEEGILVFLTGKPGCGKTHIACATLRRWVESGRPGGLFIVAGEFLHEMKQGFADGSAGGVMRRAEGARLLVLDDLGSEMATDWVRDTMYMLVNYRLNHMKPTIITSNLRLGEIAETYHARLASRLAGEFAIDMNILPDHRLVKS
jgi:DNA replication protein DnaC